MRRERAAQPAWDRALGKAMEWSKHLKTQTALARRSGVAQSTIGRILRGEVDPQSGNLHRLAGRLACRSQRLLVWRKKRRCRQGKPKCRNGSEAMQ